MLNMCSRPTVQVKRKEKKESKFPVGILWLNLIDTKKKKETFIPCPTVHHSKTQGKEGLTLGFLM